MAHGVHIGAGIDQHPHGVVIVVGDGGQQGRHAGLVLLLETGAGRFCLSLAHCDLLLPAVRRVDDDRDETAQDVEDDDPAANVMHHLRVG